MAILRYQPCYIFDQSKRLESLLPTYSSHPNRSTVKMDSRGSDPTPLNNHWPFGIRLEWPGSS